MLAIGLKFCFSEKNNETRGKVAAAAVGQVPTPGG